MEHPPPFASIEADPLFPPEERGDLREAFLDGVAHAMHQVTAAAGDWIEDREAFDAIVKAMEKMQADVDRLDGEGC